MGRAVAVVWHASFSIAAGVLYFFFVLPRWPEMVGQTSSTLGLILRIVTGVLIGLAALPVVFTLLRTRRPEFGTPRLALGLRITSIALHVLAGVLIVGTAISEIWLDLDSVGQWLFGIYGAAAAIALLGIFTFYVAFAAELPPPPPKPLKLKAKTTRRGRKAGPEAESVEAEADEDEDANEDEASVEAEETQVEATSETTSETTSEATEAPDEPSEETSEEGDSSDETGGKLRNRRPEGKSGSRKRKRSRGGVAVED